MSQPIRMFAYNLCVPKLQKIENATKSRINLYINDLIHFPLSFKDMNYISEGEKYVFVISDAFIPLIQDMKLHKNMTTNVCHGS